jgi:triosephosphate isomerase
VGHSERRALGETDEMIAKKVKAALDVGLVPILCVGESAVERASGLVESVVSHQLSLGLSLLKPLTFNLSPIVIAYEPIWAIGSHNPATPQDVVKVLQYIKKLFQTSDFRLPTILIYGGSVDASNAQDFLREKEIDGLLVGGASLNSKQIIKIVEISKSI